ncbi:MAG: aminopeptidase P family protein [Fibrobacter sp.]|nr:aminopeptidase P family protein [Fibrobacter sp.]
MKRLDKIKKLLLTNNITHLLITDTVDAEYLCGFKSSNVVLLVSANENILFTDFRYKSGAEVFCSVNTEWLFKMISGSTQETVVQYFPNGSRVGFQSNSLTVDELDSYRKHSSGVTFVALSTQVSEQFLTKENCEIELMECAAQAGDNAFEKLLGVIKPGITEIELSKCLERFCCDFGSEKPSFDTIVLFGERSALPHGRPGQKKLQEGDFILMDFGCTIGGYCSDMTRTVVCGKASSRQKEIYDIVLRAQKETCKAARCGISGKELDSVARTIIGDAGFGECFGHGTGHGVGLRIHESPRVSPFTDKILEENTVVTIEPGIYIPEFGGVRIEDMAVLGVNKSRLLTKSPKELIEL